MTDRLTGLTGTEFVNAFAINDLCDIAHANAVEKGFWETIDKKDPRHVLGLLMLITTEVAEAAEAVRIEDEKNFGEELADILIRVFDVAGGMDVNLGRAVREKMAKNAARPYKHGKVC